jgi:hypothetical protein
MIGCVTLHRHTPYSRVLRSLHGSFLSYHMSPNGISVDPGADLCAVFWRTGSIIPRVLCLLNFDAVEVAMAGLIWPERHTPIWARATETLSIRHPKLPAGVAYSPPTLRPSRPRENNGGSPSVKRP